MLQHTFLHTRGVGPALESALWRDGIGTWDDFLPRHASGALPGARYDAIAETLASSRSALERREPAFFARTLPRSESWRMFEEFADLAAYVDIETTGLSRDGDQVTVVAMHAGGTTRTFVRGRDLEDFPAAVAAFPLVVTFNGACFDLPFLASTFRGWAPGAHIDLRFPLKRLGFAGGLKRIEGEAGITRASHLRDVDGFQAVVWWSEYRAGNQRSLELLLEYARADVENLRPLAELTAERMAGKLGFARRQCRWGGLDCGSGG